LPTLIVASKSTDLDFAVPAFAAATSALGSLKSDADAFAPGSVWSCGAAVGAFPQALSANTSARPATARRFLA
jgi:hypothetical protein